MSKDLLAQWTQLQRKMSGFHSGDPETSSIWSPNTDIYDTPEGLVVKVELPGVPSNNVQVQLAEGKMVIEGVRRDPYCGATSAGYRFRQMEIEYGPFRRVVPLPYAVDAKSASARVEGGFLEVRLPRAREKMSKRITVIIQNVS
jgi:HSP20 family protein